MIKDDWTSREFNKTMIKDACFHIVIKDVFSRDMHNDSNTSVAHCGSGHIAQMADLLKKLPFPIKELGWDKIQQVEQVGELDRKSAVTLLKMVLGTEPPPGLDTRSTITISMHFRSLVSLFHPIWPLESLSA